MSIYYSKSNSTILTVAAKELKEFTLVNNKVYFRGTGGLIALAVSKAEAKEELKHVRNLSCGDNDVRLYRRLQRQGYYWPEMAKEANDI